MKLEHLEELVYGRGVAIEATPPDNFVSPAEMKRGHGTFH
jgi:hypothetical protein